MLVIETATATLLFSIAAAELPRLGSLSDRTTLPIMLFVLDNPGLCVCLGPEIQDRLPSPVIADHSDIKSVLGDPGDNGIGGHVDDLGDGELIDTTNLRGSRQAASLVVFLAFAICWKRQSGPSPRWRRRSLIRPGFNPDRPAVPHQPHPKTTASSHRKP